MVKIPATSQTKSSRPVEFTCLAISEETINMPEPIIEPATIVTASNNFSFLRELFKLSVNFEYRLLISCLERVWLKPPTPCPE